jgi:hypothetical protein
VIKLQKNTKTLPAWQAYQSLYYDRKLKTLADEAYTSYIKDIPEGTKPKGRLAILGEVAREQLQNETPEVKAEVEDYRVKLKEDVEDPSKIDQIEAYQR